jgi:hypothetical protein
VSDATSDNDFDFDFGAPIAVPAEGLLTWGRTAFAVVIVAVLVTLGIANVAMYSRWHEVEDGVLWGSRAEGVTALDVATGSAAAVAGIQRGDVLVAVNGAAVESPADVIEFQHRSKTGTRLSYTLLRLGTRQALEVSLAPSPHGSSMYFVLAAVGLFTLLVGASVRVRRPRDQATLHFFWLCVAFFGVFTFSFNGPFDRLDWIFYWGDAVAFAMLAPLLLHFTLVFPERGTLALSTLALGTRAPNTLAPSAPAPSTLAPARPGIGTQHLAPGTSAPGAAPSTQHPAPAREPNVPSRPSR